MPRAELRRGAGSQFDPEVVRALLVMLDRDSDGAWVEKAAA